jgi:O-antigen ligase
MLHFSKVSTFKSIDFFFQKFIYIIFIVLPVLMYVSIDYNEFEMPKLICIAASSLTLAFGLFKKSLRYVTTWTELVIHPIEILVGLFLVSVLISFFVNGASEISLWGISSMQVGSTYSLLSTAIFAFLTSRWISTARQIESLIRAILLGGCLVALVAIGEYFFKFHLILFERISYDNSRAISTIGISIAMGMLVGMMAVISGFLFASRPRFQIFYLIAFVILVLGVFVSGSRGPIYTFMGWFTFLMAGLWTFYRNELDTALLKRQVLAGAVVIGAAAITFGFAAPTVIQKSTGAKVNLGFAVRMEYWKVALDVFKESPVFGIGPENFMSYFRLFMHNSHNEFQTWKNAINKVHNEPLQILSTQGGVGFFLYIALHLFVGLFILRFFSKQKKYEGFLLFGLASSFIYQFICNLVGFNLVYTQLLFFLFPLLVAKLDWATKLTLNVPVAVCRAGLAGLLVCLFFATAKYSEQYKSFHEYSISLKDLGRGDFVKAYERVNEAINQTPNKSFLYCYRARVVMLTFSYQNSRGRPVDKESQGRIFSDVDRDIETCSELGHGTFDLYNDLAQFYSFFHAQRPEYVDRGIMALEGAIKYFPKNPNNWVNLGVFYRQKGDLQKSRECVDQALELKPDYSGAILEKYLLNYQQESFEVNHALLRQLTKNMVYYKNSIDFREASRFLLQNMINVAKENNDEKALELIKELVEVYDSIPEEIVR